MDVREPEERRVKRVSLQVTQGEETRTHPAHDVGEHEDAAVVTVSLTWYCNSLHVPPWLRARKTPRTLVDGSCPSRFIAESRTQRSTLSSRFRIVVIFVTLPSSSTLECELCFICTSFQPRRSLDCVNTNGSRSKLSPLPIRAAR